MFAFCILNFALHSVLYTTRFAPSPTGKEPPHFFHHPLIIRPDGEKLSMSSRDTGVRELRADNVDSATVIGLAAAAVGLVERGERVAADASADSWTTTVEDDDDESRKELRENSACFFAPPWPCSCLTEEPLVLRGIAYAPAMLFDVRHR